MSINEVENEQYSVINWLEMIGGNSQIQFTIRSTLKIWRVKSIPPIIYRYDH